MYIVRDIIIGGTKDAHLARVGMWSWSCFGQNKLGRSYVRQKYALHELAWISTSVLTGVVYFTWLTTVLMESVHIPRVKFRACGENY